MTGLLEFAGVLRRRAWMVALTALLATGVAIVATLLRPPDYSATTVLHLDTDALTTGTDRLESLSLQRVLNTYAELAESDVVLAPVERQLGIPLGSRVDVSPVPNTDLLEVKAEASTPTLAVQAANSVAGGLTNRLRGISERRITETQQEFTEQLDVLSDERAEAQQEFDELRASGLDDPATQGNLSRLQSQIQAVQTAIIALQQRREERRISDLNAQKALSIVEPAREAEETSNSGLVTGGLGLILGLLAGAGLALVYERLNPRFNTPDELVHAAAIQAGSTADLIIGRIPTKLSLSMEALASDRELDAYGRIRMRIFGSNGRSPVRSLLLMSADGGDEKSAVAVHLAASLARLGRKTLLVDGDLRRPMLDSVFGLDNSVGLSGVLRGTTELDDAIEATQIPSLSVLPAGPELGAPDRLLARERLAQVMRNLGKSYESVIIDSPDLLSASDALLLAGSADAVILVASPRLRRSGLQSVIEDLQHSRASFMGVIITAPGLGNATVSSGQRDQGDVSELWR